jgi:hypothetical protein
MSSFPLTRLLRSISGLGQSGRGAGAAGHRFGAFNCETGEQRTAQRSRKASIVRPHAGFGPDFRPQSKSTAGVQNVLSCLTAVEYGAAAGNRS